MDVNVASEAAADGTERVRSTLIGFMRAAGRAAPAVVFREVAVRLGSDAEASALRAMSALVSEQLVALEACEDHPRGAIVHELRWLGSRGVE